MKSSENVSECNAQMDFNETYIKLKSTLLSTCKIPYRVINLACGAPDIIKTTGGRYSKGIVGCISDLILDSDLSVPLSSPGQATNTHSCIP
ncbi:hypothetical protein M0804_015449 [Polistes exclamans]|nr:hypothetical protein M0804_015449 [Polistes exclamans]